MANKIRLRQEIIEVTSTPPASGRVGQETIEVSFGPAPPNSHVAQLAVEALGDSSPPAILGSQVAIEILEEVLPC